MAVTARACQADDEGLLPIIRRQELAATWTSEARILGRVETLGH